MSESSFSENEKVLAFHQGMIYEAKVQKATFTAEKPVKDPLRTPVTAASLEESQGPPQWWYLLHYQGWNDRWDEWVDASRLLKYNDENKQLQAKMAEDHKAAKAAKAKAAASSSMLKKKPSNQTTTTKGDSSSPQPFVKKKKSDDSVSSPLPSLPSPQISLIPSSSQLPSSSTTNSSASASSSTYVELILPLALKRKLVDDWEQITQERSLVPLPRTPCVAEIIRSFQQSRGDPSPLPFDPVLASIVAYFDKALGSILLYRFERQQYAWVLKQYPHTPMSHIYGAEHLLRFTMKLPSLIPGHEMLDETRARIEMTISDLLRYLNRHLSTLFDQDYEPAPPVYLRSTLIN
eukprot:TRINITY_DN4693_c0_g1_i3.p1 TRINITY_DN4693_c0_g1~~TRINITY_DN4693_c0_g1_i3.p1  ORF type:complete len:349 (+),score=65.25 TRINITY_DN4693_c0_g1_i3:238-1284(+)